MTAESSLPRPQTGTQRRAFLLGSAAVTAGLATHLIRDHQRRTQSAEVVIAKAADYHGDLAAVLRQGLAELGIDRAKIKGKSILLKPNMVEPAVGSPHINTHPLMVAAAVETFRRLDAKEVFVAEGQGHCRDTPLVLELSGLQQVLDHEKIEFVDLNHDDVYFTRNAVNQTQLQTLCLPTSLRRADLVVSLPKLKTHHWAGVTLSMKNLFGVMPGICYGWPKNVLHQAGIEGSIVDIAGTVKPGLAIVDGIVGMEGDGPIMGTPKSAGVVIMGTNLPAVDATAARVMQFDPQHILYLTLAADRLGPIDERRIEQRGEAIAAVQQRFELLDHPHMRRFRPV